MNELYHVPRLLKHIRKNWLASKTIKHADKITSGVPDFTHTARKKTSWWEVKWANPYVDTQGDQHLNCLQLAAYGDCWYIIFGMDKGEPYTAIAAPKDVDRKEGTFVATTRVSGHDYDFVLNFMRSVHT
jgi:hypothetical protein